ncbi:RimJ/RimL family protein N-acetyltransferase [Methanomicrobium sp. W14]|uniref:GNAT family N-acetyltransferase n=1 Tax=Methanomicrobium sp. W14 TaxID=2817839 RepID=UPI001AE18BE9|nr:GNAT family N-acetyltransferase [Methanomicrobium sp. W14]MBP2132505.1 RimJ/RimL family protein N-acetyltransferase [Methanomicrobium sp. W14]
MDSDIIITKRLFLIPETEETLEYELGKRGKPGTLSSVDIPENWPHETVTKEVFELFLGFCKEKRLYSYYWVLKGENKDSKEYGTLIGSGGIILHENALPEIGYSVLKQFENMGYATEAVSAIVKKAFQSGLASEITAKTEKNNIPSQRVLDKNGFIKSGTENETGLLVYILKKK